MFIFSFLPFSKFSCQSLNSSKFSGANWSEVSWMREQNCPLIADPGVKVDASFSGIRIKVWYNITKLDCRHLSNQFLAYPKKGIKYTFVKFSFAW